MRFALIFLVALWPSLSIAQDGAIPDPEAETRADLADAQAAIVAQTIMTSPALMRKVVNDALREDPDVVKTIIRDTLLRNPEIVVGALQEYQRRMQAGKAETPSSTDQSLSPELLSDLRNSDNAFVGGNPNGSVTIVEFFDYNCGFCRRFAPVLDDLIEANPDLRVVYREWPILSQHSVDAARLVLAARNQGAYEEMHDALFAASGGINAPKALKIARKLGLDVEKLEKDAMDPVVTSHLNESVDLAKRAGFRGTPSMLVADQLAFGLLKASQIQPILDRAHLK